MLFSFRGFQQSYALRLLLAEPFEDLDLFELVDEGVRSPNFTAGVKLLPLGVCAGEGFGVSLLRSREGDLLDLRFFPFPFPFPFPFFFKV